MGHHPYIISLHHAFQTSTQLVLVLHYCPNGNLQQAIRHCKRFPEGHARLYSAEILLALVYLHERGIIFRDLKPDNVVLDGSGHGLLTDFGLAREHVIDLHGARSFCGSPAFIAPEMLDRKGHGHTVDIYGLGVALFNMLTGKPPFYNKNLEVLQHNVKCAPLQIPTYVSQPGASLISALMHRMPERRLGAARTSDIQNDRFFISMDFRALLCQEVPVPPEMLAVLGAISSNSHSFFHSAPFGPKNDICDEQLVEGWEFNAVAQDENKDRVDFFEL